jgi:uncharacterized protein YbaR (Trm112 family)
MKPWLLNILACPIDKHHPLEAYFFSWETEEAYIEKLASEQGTPNPDLNEKYKLLLKQMKDGTISPNAIKEIKDETDSKLTKQMYLKTIDALNQLVNKKPSTLDNDAKELDALYKYLNVVEVSEGVLFCPICSRWYPIGCAVESIPELMPDELREREKELIWLEKWYKKTPEKILRKGQPYNLS